MSVPGPQNLDTTKHLWYNSNVQSVSASLGLNSSPSTISLTLYDDEKAGEIFQKPVVGTATSIKYEGLEFYGILMDWQKSTGMGGISYSVSLSDIRELTSKVMLVLEHNGGMYLRENIRAALTTALSQSYVEGTDEFNTVLAEQMAIYETAIPGISSFTQPLQLIYVGYNFWSQIMAKINATTIYVNQIGFTLRFDPNEWPDTLIQGNAFTVNSDAITFNDMMDDLGRRCGFDWYLDCSNDFLHNQVVYIRNIDRRAAPTQITTTETSNGLVLSPASTITGKIIDFNEGESFVNEGTGAILFGGRRRDITTLPVEGHLYDVICGKIGRIYADTNEGMTEVLGDVKMNRMLSDHSVNSAKAFLTRFSVNLSDVTQQTDASAYEYDQVYENLKGYYVPSTNELMAALADENTWIQCVIKNNGYFQRAFPKSYWLYQKTGCATITLNVALLGINDTAWPVKETYKEIIHMKEDEKTANPTYYYWVFVYDRDANTTTVWKTKTSPLTATIKNCTDFTMPADGAQVFQTTGCYNSTEAPTVARLEIDNATVNMLQNHDMPLFTAIYNGVKSLAEQYMNKAFALDTNEINVMSLGMDQFVSSFMNSTIHTKSCMLDFRPEVWGKKLIRDSGWWRKTLSAGSYTLDQGAPEWATQLNPYDYSGYNAALRNAVCQYFEDGAGLVPTLCQYKNVDLGWLSDIQADEMFLDNIRTTRGETYSSYGGATLPLPTGDDARFYTWERKYLFYIQTSTNVQNDEVKEVMWFADKQLATAFSTDADKTTHKLLPQRVIYVLRPQDPNAQWTFWREIETCKAGSGTTIDQEIELENKISKGGKWRHYETTVVSSSTMTFYSDIMSRVSLSAPFFVMLVDTPLTIDENLTGVPFASMFEDATDLVAADLSKAVNGNLQAIMDVAKRKKLTDAQFVKAVQKYMYGPAKSLCPDYAFVPVELPTKYGPYITSGLGAQPNGLVEYINDESFVPDNYGGENVLNTVMQGKVDSLAFQNKVQYTYNVNVTGVPQLNIGAKLCAGAVNSNITGLTIARDMSGIKTSYAIQSRHRQWDKLIDPTTNKQPAISNILTEAQKKLAQINNLKEFRRAKQIIQTIKAKTAQHLLTMRDSLMFNKKIDMDGISGKKTN